MANHLCCSKSLVVEASSDTASSTSELTTSSSDSCSLLDHLRMPKPSELSRKRKIPCNPPPKGQKKGKGVVTSEPRRVAALTRVAEFPDSNLSVVLGRLFCNACREHLSLKKSVIELHLKSTKHGVGVERLKSKQTREQSILHMLEKYDKEVHPVGEKLPDCVRLQRIKVLICFLKAGLPLKKIDCFRDLLEETSYRLTSSQHLAEMIPIVRQQQAEKIVADIQGKHISVVFDGTTHVCEAMVIIVRFIDNYWCIKQYVVKIMLLAKALSGEEVARELMVCISTGLGISGDRLVATMRDRAAVNNVAMRTVKVLYPNVIDIGCFSHTLDIVGEKFKTPVLDEFLKAWIGIFSRSIKTKFAWKSKTGLPIPSYSSTRWWSKWEVVRQIHDSFGDIHAFLQDAELPPSRLKMLAILDNPPEYRKLQIELAVTVDAGEPFVKSTYRLEGDGPLALIAYEEISTVRAAVTTEHYPNVVAVSNKLTTVPAARNQLISYAKACVKPAYEYFEKKFNEDLVVPLAIFKCARLFDPVKICDMKPALDDIDTLRILPFLNNDVSINNLKSELPLYLATAEGVSQDIDKLEWWKKHEKSIPNWASACKSTLLIQPSSGAAERAFSILSNCFTNKQTQSLQDYIETSVMLQYNA